jgi:serine protease
MAQLSNYPSSNRLLALKPLVAVFSFVLITVWSTSGPAQSAPVERLPGTKLSLEGLLAMPASDRVVVKFKEGRRVRLSSGRLVGVTSGEAQAFAAALRAERVPLRAIRRLHARPESELDQERAAAERQSGRSLADLNLYYVIKLPAGVNAAALAHRLNGLAFVEFAEPGPVPVPPPTDIPPTSPALTGSQGYKHFSTGGIGTLRPSVYPGVTGSGRKFVDVEYSWQLDHEDLEIPASRVLAGGATPSDPFHNNDHGTAVLGEIHGKRNSYGVTGIAPAAQAWVAPVQTVENGFSPARAIGLATGFLGRGDVIIIEQQTYVCNYRPVLSFRPYGPLEWDQSVFDALSIASAFGIIVVEAAGNGNINLDDAKCDDKFNREVRDSYAIIVGAGSSTDHSRLSFSSYGSRVDVQGWGENVTTTGYGDAFNPGDARQKYTRIFSGTSSATPIVAGAVLDIEGRLEVCGHQMLVPFLMRQALVDTGTPQGNPGTGHIGPLPHIKAALKAIAPVCVNAGSDEPLLSAASP